MAAASLPFLQYLSGRRIVFLIDAFHQYYPAQVSLTRVLAEAPGRLPLWNPYLACGMPLLADPQTHVLYPPALVFRFLPFAAAFGWFITIHAVLATIGMAVFLRDRGASPGASAIGAIGFGLGAHPSLLLAVPPVLCGYAWLPWVGVAAARLADRAGPRETAWLAVAFGWLLLAGSPPHAVYGIALAALLLVLPRSASPPRLRAAAAAAAIGLALAAGLLLPVAGYLHESIRGGALATGIAGVDGIPPAGFLGLLLPSAVIPPGPGPAAVRLWPTLHYLGLAPALLALWALAACRSRGRVCGRVRTPAGIALLGALLAMGPHLPFLGPLLLALPPLDHLRHPGSWMGVGGFGLAWLAAIGADDVAVRLHRAGTTRLVLVVLAAVTWADLAFLRARIQIDASAEAAMTPGRTERFLAGETGAKWQRVLISHRLQEGDEVAAGPDEAVRLLRDSLRSNLTAAAGFRDVDADNPMGPARTAALLFAARTARSPWTPPAAGILADLGVRNLLTGAPIPGAPVAPVLRGHVTVYRLPARRGPVWLEPAGAGTIDPPTGCPPGQWTFRVRAMRPCTAVVSESFLRGWRAESPAGAPLTITHGTLIGVALPAGNHAVRLRYDPWQAKAGLGMGLLAAVALLGAGLSGFRTQVRSPDGRRRPKR